MSAPANDAAATEAPAPEGPPLFFLHIMKTAGTTFFFHLRARFGPTWVFPAAHQGWRPMQQGNRMVYFEVDALLGMPMAQRLGFKGFAGHYPYVATEMLGFDVQRLAILRDPVARTVSFLRHAKQYHPEFREATATEIYEDRDTNERFVQDHQTKVFALTQDDEPRSVLDVVPMDRDRLALAKERLETIDLLGVQERFDDFLAGALARFGIEQQEDVDDQRVSEVELDVDDALRDRIAEDNALDVELYAHAVDLVDRRSRGEATPPSTHPPVVRVLRGEAPDPPPRQGPMLFAIHIARTETAMVNRDLRANLPAGSIYPYPDGLPVSGRLVPRTDIRHLLGIPPDLLDGIAAISGHFPYVVSRLLPVETTTIVLLRDPVERIIDQLRHRVARDVYGEDRTLEEVYEDEAFFTSNLHDHQVRQFAMTADDPLETFLDPLDVDDRRLAVAIANLEAVDVLGLTEELPAFRRRLVDRFGWRQAKPRPPSADPDAPHPDAALRARIVADNQADIAFYEHARSLVQQRTTGG